MLFVQVLGGLMLLVIVGIGVWNISKYLVNKSKEIDNDANRKKPD